MTTKSGKIDSRLLLASNAALAEQVDLFSDVATARWSIDRNSVRFEKPDSHTLSLYLKGGETSCRADRTDLKGAPGRLCMMPAGHRSDWQIGGHIDFAHVYFTDALLKARAVDRFDCDARTIELTDLVYGDDARLRSLMLGFMNSYAGGDDTLLEAEERLGALLDHLLDGYNAFTRAPTPLKGGLSPRHRQQVIAAIEAGLDSKLTIEGLAALVGLSPYHFARMFAQSFGMGPARYILRARLARVKRLLATRLTLADISAQAGFAQQSHMTEHFRKMIGITPARYRKAVAA